MSLCMTTDEITFRSELASVLRRVPYGTAVGEQPQGGLGYDTVFMGPTVATEGRIWTRWKARYAQPDMKTVRQSRARISASLR